MKKRLESFKTTKLGINHSKKINKNYKRERGPKRRNSSMNIIPNGNITYNNSMDDYKVSGKEMDFSDQEENVDNDFADGRTDFLFSINEQTLTDNTFGIDNPLFSSNDEHCGYLEFSPWMSNEDSVMPSQRARVQIPSSPNNFRHLTPFRLSNRSIDSFVLSDGAEERLRSFLPEAMPM